MNGFLLFHGNNTPKLTEAPRILKSKKAAQNRNDRI
tara:strand:- start:145 stop:252 length:108 start_codon:yes stop_codon:yes gene_type:complete